MRLASRTRIASLSSFEGQKHPEHQYDKLSIISSHRGVHKNVPLAVIMPYHIKHILCHYYRTRPGIQVRDISPLVCLAVCHSFASISCRLKDLVMVGGMFRGVTVIRTLQQRPLNQLNRPAEVLLLLLLRCQPTASP